MKWAGRMCSEILNKIKESTNFPLCLARVRSRVVFGQQLEDVTVNVIITS